MEAVLDVRVARNRPRLGIRFGSDGILRDWLGSGRRAKPLQYCTALEKRVGSIYSGIHGASRAFLTEEARRSGRGSGFCHYDRGWCESQSEVLAAAKRRLVHGYPHVGSRWTITRISGPPQSTVNSSRPEAVPKSPQSCGFYSAGGCANRLAPTACRKLGEFHE